MNHDDFKSLSLDDVLGVTLAQAQQSSGSSVVHWISDFGLSRVRAENEERFASEDVMTLHVRSYPTRESVELVRHWAKVIQDFSSFGVRPVEYEGRTLGYLQFEGRSAVGHVDLNVAAKYLAFAYEHLAARADSYLDELTGLYNQRYLPMALELEIARARRERQSFTLLFLDVDFFKAVNDGRGHWVGSRLLNEIGQILKTQVRACDYCFRYGGDEFIVLLGNVDQNLALNVAERIRSAVEANVFSIEGQDIQLTVSIGLATYPAHAATAASLIQIADEAMYKGKRKSRNIVFVAS